MKITKKDYEGMVNASREAMGFSDPASGQSSKMEQFAERAMNAWDYYMSRKGWISPRLGGVKEDHDEIL